MPDSPPSAVVQYQVRWENPAGPCSLRAPGRSGCRTRGSGVVAGVNLEAPLRSAWRDFRHATHESQHVLWKHRQAGAHMLGLEKEARCGSRILALPHSRLYAWWREPRGFFYFFFKELGEDTRIGRGLATRGLWRLSEDCPWRSSVGE
jgi:hypothetical protein